MPTMRAILVSLGSTGAAANALAALQQRARDEQAVAGLEARLAPLAAGAPLAAAVATAA